MLIASKPVDGQKDFAMQGFGLFDRVDDSADVVATDWDTGQNAAGDADEREAYRVSDWDEAGSVRDQRTVLFKPILGILDQGKLIPLRYCPLQIELELVSNSPDCVYVGLVKNDICNEIGAFQTSNAKLIYSRSIQASKMNMRVICFQAKVSR